MTHLDILCAHVGSWELTQMPTSCDANEPNADVDLCHPIEQGPTQSPKRRRARSKVCGTAFPRHGPGCYCLSKLGHLGPCTPSWPGFSEAEW